jgi:hypothetical protein
MDKVTRRDSWSGGFKPANPAEKAGASLPANARPNTTPHASLRSRLVVDPVTLADPLGEVDPVIPFHIGRSFFDASLPAFVWTFQGAAPLAPG